MTFPLLTSRKTWGSGSHPACPSHITTLWLQRRVSPFWIWFWTALRKLCPASPGIRQLCRSLKIADGINCLERVQCAATRCASGMQQYPYVERLLLLKLYPLDFHRLCGDLILTFRVFAKNQARNFFTLTGESSLRGHDRKILKLHCRTSVRLRSFAVRVIQP